MTSKHTPGPWFVSNLRAGVAIVDANETTVAAAHKRPCRLLSAPAEQEANARLIAAAPDLLTTGRKLAAEVGALRAFEDEIRTVIGNTNWSLLMARLAEADAAIAKVEG